MEPMIEIKGVSKQYLISTSKGYYRGINNRLGENLSEAIRHPLRTIRGVRQAKEAFWALRGRELQV